MSRSMAVTRTFSMGNCSTSSTASESQDTRSARRHSLVGMKALWANSNSRSFGWERVTSKDNILSNVLTPGSIPQFTIPRLALEDNTRSTSQDRGGEGSRQEDEDDSEMVWDTEYSSGGMSTSLSSSSSHSSSTSSGFHSSPAMRRKAHRSVSDPESLKDNFMQWETSSRGSQLQHLQHYHQRHFDPASCAALSLPHLAKVTTPYGFVTLSQSPQMASEEALLCQAGVGRRWAGGRVFEDEGYASVLQRRGTMMELRKTLSCQGQIPTTRPRAGTGCSTGTGTSTSPHGTSTDISTHPCGTGTDTGTSSSTSTSSTLASRPTPVLSGLGSERPDAKDGPWGMVVPRPGGSAARSAGPGPGPGAKPGRCRLWGVLRKHLKSQRGLQRQDNSTKDGV